MKPRIEWDTAILWALLITIGVLMFLAAQTEKANAQEPLQATETGQGCTDPQTGEQGLLGATGTCWTATLYDHVFSAENLATVPDQLDPSRSVADVYGLTPDMDAESKPSTRSRTFTYPGGVTVYQSFVNIIKTAQAI